MADRSPTTTGEPVLAWLAKRRETARTPVQRRLGTFVLVHAAAGGIINGATEPAPQVGTWTAILTRALLTFSVVSAILGTASGARAHARRRQPHPSLDLADRLTPRRTVAVGFEYILRGRATEARAAAAQGIVRDDNSAAL